MGFLAIGMPRSETAVFIQVYCCYLREIEISFGYPFGKLFVGADWRIPRGEAENALGVKNHLRRNNVSRFTAHIGEAVCVDNFQ